MASVTGGFWDLTKKMVSYNDFGSRAGVRELCKLKRAHFLTLGVKVEIWDPPPLTQYATKNQL